MTPMAPMVTHPSSAFISRCFCSRCSRCSRSPRLLRFWGRSWRVVGSENGDLSKENGGFSISHVDLTKLSALVNAGFSHYGWLFKCASMAAKINPHWDESWQNHTIWGFLQTTSHLKPPDLWLSAPFSDANSAAYKPLKFKSLPCHLPCHHIFNIL